MQLFVIKINVGIKINADVNAKNWLINMYVIKDIFGIQVILSCDVGEYLDYKDCECRIRLIDKLVDECAEIVEEVKAAIITLAENENSYKWSSCTVYTVLFWIFFTGI